MHHRKSNFWIKIMLIYSMGPKSRTHDFKGIKFGLCVIGSLLLAACACTWSSFLIFCDSFPTSLTIPCFLFHSGARNWLIMWLLKKQQLKKSLYMQMYLSLFRNSWHKHSAPFFYISSKWPFEIDWAESHKATCCDCKWNRNWISLGSAKYINHYILVFVHPASFFNCFLLWNWM